MTRHRQEFAREGSGLAFMSPRTVEAAGKLKGVAAENARRQPCGICGLAVLPENMARHHERFHAEDL